MSVMIGVDPHKQLHQAVAIDGVEVELSRVEVRATRRQVEQLLGWATLFPERTWAIECAGGLGYLLAQQLVDAGEHVIDVPATLASRVRLLGSGRSNKNDANDALSVAVAALRAPVLRTVCAADHAAVLRLLAKHHRDLGRERNRAANRLHSLLVELVPAGITKELRASHAQQLLDDVVARSPADAARYELALEVLADVRRLDTQMAASKKRVDDAVEASKTSLTDVFGIGPITAAMLIGYTGDIGRFHSADHYAAYNGTAPREVSSAGRGIHRLSRRGNRQLNHAIHIVAVTQIRHRHSDGRAYYDRKIREGKTGKMALRALKRQISKTVYRHLVADNKRRG